MSVEEMKELLSAEEMKKEIYFKLNEKLLLKIQKKRPSP